MSEDFLDETSLNAVLPWFLSGSASWLSTGSAEEPNLLTDSYEEAESLYRETFSIYERHLGPEHHLTASIIHNLAMLYEKQGRDEEAKPLFQSALAIYKRLLESEDFGTPFFKNIGYLYLRQDMYEEAEMFFQRELTDWEQRSGPEQTVQATWSIRSKILPFPR